jgi:NADH-quinone oxidoreductase subunit N
MDYFSDSLISQFGALLPELFLAVIALSALIFSRFGRPHAVKRLYTILWAQGLVLLFSIWWLFAHVVAALPGHIKTQYLFGGSITVGIWQMWAVILLQFVSLVIAWMAKRYSQRVKRLPLEFLGLLNASTLSLSLMLKASDLGLLFVSLEASGLIVALMLALGSLSLPKAALKYLVLSGISAVVLLWGIVLIYLSTGSLNYSEISHSLTSASAIWLLPGVGLVVASLFFKLGVFPFSYWLPEVYEGASLPVLAYLATASKLAAGFVLLFLLQGPFQLLVGALLPLCSVLIILTLIFGALGALKQTSIKRLLSLSGVVHAGFITAAVFGGFPLTFFYFLGYVPALLLILYLLTEAGEENPTIEDLKKFRASYPRGGVLMIVAFASMAGLPPLVGFWAKFWVLIGTLYQQQWWILSSMILASVLALYYYLQVVFSLLGAKNDEGHSHAAALHPLTLSTRFWMIALLIILISVGILGPISL